MPSLAPPDWVVKREYTRRNRDRVLNKSEEYILRRLNLEEDYQAFVHLAVEGAPPTAQSDGSPGSGLDQTGTEVVDRRALLIPDTVEPSRYQVIAGLYRLSDGSRLPVSGSGGQEVVLLGHVDVYVP